MQKIVVLNPKGGSGKSTLATNLASYFAVQQSKPTLMDLDLQGSSMRWLSKRKPEQPQIYGVAGFERKSGITRSFALRVPHDSQCVIVDTPAALDPQRLPELTKDAQAILVPVLPSDIDIHAATRCISDLLLIAKIKRSDQRIAVRARIRDLQFRAALRDRDIHRQSALRKRGQNMAFQPRPENRALRRITTLDQKNSRL